MQIENIVLSNDQVISLGKISILVGPNNVGKSQTLRDIQTVMQSGLAAKRTLIKSIKFVRPDTVTDLLKHLTISNSTTTLGYIKVSGMNNSLTGADSMETSEDHLNNQFSSNNNLEWTLGNIAKFKVSLLDSSMRLHLVSTTPSFNPDYADAGNILQNMFLDKENENLLRIAFSQAFGMDILLDYSGLTEMCLRVSKEFPEIPEDPRSAYPIMKEFSKIDNQGDGFKSFVGIILGLLFSKDRIILLDEPEAFLHPAQARYLGKWIADNLDKFSGQIIISTHNSNFLSGLLQSDNKIDIFRLNRNLDNTTFKLIPPEATEQLSKSPMLSSQRVLEAIFHKAVIVCEADADRIIYQSISTLYHRNQEVLFVYSHNKQTLKDVAKLLVATQIPVGVIVDIDILNDQTDFSNLYEAVNQSAPPEEFLNKRKLISESVENSSEIDALSNIKTIIEEFLGQLNKNEHTFSGAKGAINRIKKDSTKWSVPKKSGIDGFDEAIKPIAIELIDSLKNNNIFVVPCGELEGWIEVGTSQKNKWILPALTEIFEGRAPEALTQFVQVILSKVTKDN